MTKEHEFTPVQGRDELLIAPQVIEVEHSEPEEQSTAPQRQGSALPTNP